jgi:hypothetical protein
MLRVFAGGEDMAVFQWRHVIPNKIYVYNLPDARDGNRPGPAPPRRDRPGPALLMPPRGPPRPPLRPRPLAWCAARRGGMGGGSGEDEERREGGAEEWIKGAGGARGQGDSAL